MRRPTLSHGPVGFVCDCLEAVAGLLVVVLFALMIGVVSYEVVMRYVFNAPTFWSGELARWAMVWVALVGLALAVRHLDNIKVDVLVDAVPRPVQVVMAILRFVFAFAFAGVMLVYGIRLMRLNAGQTSPGLEWSVSILYLAPTVSAVLMLAFLAELALRRDIRPF
ncbi:TRAP transporter small permease [Acuticoccus yangtzensis]|uniref:TRAP transporter small permease n=1 Tax=Acuticoccus yangtzensis TaxID=1443441 RepID=UPI00094979A4|nr:TRAP transporter small permease [Acuticoccus yangtzensis]ORE91342.1 tripartite AtP-independent periplasmic transporter subunit DctQ [Stappia sp. 22II-S9-Z10]